MGRVQRRFSSSTGKIRGFLVGPNRGRQKLLSIYYIMGWRAVLPTGWSVLDFALPGNAEHESYGRLPSPDAHPSGRPATLPRVKS